MYLNPSRLREGKEPPVISHSRMLGLIPSLKSLAHDYSVSGVVINITTDDVPGPIPEDLALCLFRIVQEGVQNAIKHGGARTISVALQRTGRMLYLSIVDNGVGFDTKTVWGNGLGLVSMRERIEQFGGTLKIDSARGRGTQLQFAVAISGEANSTSA